MREIDDIPFGEGPPSAPPKKQSRAPRAQSPPPEKQSPPPDAQSPPPSPKRKRRTAPKVPAAPRPEPEVAAGTSGEEENTRPATRKERMKEKVDCDHCGKQITRHAQLYTHAKNCKGQQRQAYEPSSPKPSLASYVPREPPQQQRPQQAPDEEFMERLRRASLAYQQLDRQKHSSVIRNFYGY